MSELIAHLEKALGDLVQEIPQEASVLVQFAAGDWAKIKAAFLAEKDLIRQALTVQPVPTEPVAPPAESPSETEPHEE